MLRTALVEHTSREIMKHMFARFGMARFGMARFGMARLQGKLQGIAYIDDIMRMIILQAHAW